MPADRYYTHERNYHPLSTGDRLWDRTLQRSGRLGQEYVCAGYIKSEDAHLDFLRSDAGQNQIRAQCYQDVVDHVDGADAGVAIGRIVLPASVRGSKRKMAGAFQDAMATVKHMGVPSLFITFTANSKAPEILACLERPDQDRWDLVSEVFNAHVRQMIKEMTTGLKNKGDDKYPEAEGELQGVLGDSVARFHVLEFQSASGVPPSLSPAPAGLTDSRLLAYAERGLPHIHLLLWLQKYDAPTTAEKIDQIISARLPDGRLAPDVLAAVRAPAGGEQSGCAAATRRLTWPLLFRRS